MADPKCKITWHSDNTIDYTNCSNWRYVGAKYNKSDNSFLMYLIDGESCQVFLTQLGKRWSVRAYGYATSNRKGYDICKNSFILQGK
jgi:hypothetical protein